MGHIELAKWADQVLVAPASADFLARLANGFADDLLTTVCCATEAPIVVAPAMNQAMWKNHRTRRTVALLAEDPQIAVWGPGQGEQACGDTGPGRMLEPAELARRVLGGADERSGGLLRGKRVVITAGPTREPIDPVRYVSNNSSGKMGYALAEAALRAGATVILVSGPVSLAPPPGADVRPVETAAEMLSAVEQAVDEGCDIFVATAAVADYRPESCADDKIKKSRDTMTLSLVRNPDILATVAARAEAPFTVGFAAETRDLAHYAMDKLKRKKLDMIVANDVSEPGIGFNSDRNAVTVFWSSGQQSIGPDSKQAIAERLVALVAQHQTQD
jgi:phosphopantothenoylcysteine decarboxylase/phosphopantothenate--cysteine ligase